MSFWKVGFDFFLKAFLCIYSFFNKFVRLQQMASAEVITLCKCKRNDTTKLPYFFATYKMKFF